MPLDPHNATIERKKSPIVGLFFCANANKNVHYGELFDTGMRKACRN